MLQLLKDSHFKYNDLFESLSLPISVTYAVFHEQFVMQLID